MPRARRKTASAGVREGREDPGRKDTLMRDWAVALLEESSPVDFPGGVAAKWSATEVVTPRLVILTRRRWPWTSCGIAGRRRESRLGAHVGHEANRSFILRV